MKNDAGITALEVLIILAIIALAVLLVRWLVVA